MKFISVKVVKQIQETLIEEFGGQKGIRSENLLDSAVSRMRASFDGKDLYLSIFEKAAALFESLCKNHPFVDGNKRIAFVSAVTFLEINGYKTIFDPEEAEEFVLKVITQKVELKKIAKFLQNHSRLA